MLRKLKYISLVLLTLPLVPLAVFTGLFETALGTNSLFTLWIIRPFLWAVESNRKRGE